MLILYVLSALAIVGMAGLVLDLGNAYLTRTRLQNALDAAALDGADALANGLSVTDAKAVANATFKTNFSDTLRSTGTVTVQTSNTCNCDGVSAFIDGTLPAKYMKVSAASVPVRTYLINVLRPGNTVPVGGSAIAGPQSLGETCGAIPVAICAKNITDTDCSDGSCFGFSTGVPFTTQDKASLGPGNWGLVELQCDQSGNCATKTSSSASDIRTGMAGGANICFTPGTPIPTKPGATTGPVDQGVNTRFNDYSGGGVSSAQYPGDVVTVPRLISTPYSAYAALVATKTAWDNPTGTAGRRISAAPVIDCSATSGSGQQLVNVIGSMCLFLTMESVGGNMTVEMISSCRSSTGTPSPTPSPTGPTRTVLYQSSSSS